MHTSSICRIFDLMNKEGKIEKLVTGDGSSTLYNVQLDETYHSTKGAQTESEFIYLEHGLNEIMNNPEKKEIHILEVGFGTGLNAILTLKACKDFGGLVKYDTYEAYPLEDPILNELEFPVLSDIGLSELWHRMHTEKEFSVGQFHFHLFVQKIEEAKIRTKYYDVIYYDAFAPSKQADIWDPSILKMMYDALVPGGRLVTYCAQGQFKRDLKSIGFDTLHPPGPMGKKEMTIAIR